MSENIVIIGAGVAGLACAQELAVQNREFIILEASERAGGRIKTDVVDGYRLDRGFQVLQTGYPDLTSFLDLKELNLQTYPSGVAIRSKNKFNIIADPRSHPSSLIATVTAPIGTIADRYRMLKLVRNVSSMPFEDLFEEPEEPVEEYLKRLGFSDRFISCFFLPFFAGATLERELSGSSRVLNYLVRVFAGGTATIPELGMGEISRQLLEKLDPESIRYNSRVAQIDGNEVRLESGERVTANEIVVATDEGSATKLIGTPSMRKVVGETCLYFGTDWYPPHDEPFLVLNGDESGPINNLAYPSLVSARYAPEGRTLIAAVVLDEQVRYRDDLEALVRAQCSSWYGPVVDTWEHIRTYQIDYGLPQQLIPTTSPYAKPQFYQPHLQICGEYQSLPGLQWSLISGKLAARNIIKAA